MHSFLKPATEWELQRTIYDAAQARAPLEIMGNGSKRAVGRELQTEAVISTQSLTGIRFYEPTELVMSARAGTPLTRVEAELDMRGQMLAFEPLELGPLFGAERGGSSIGGVFAANLSGPRRIAAGAARDHILGINAVTGTGQNFRSGGRVMKNVTGYDLAKFVCGSWGTLGVLTEVTFKVLPKAEETATVLLFGLDDTLAVEALSTAMGTPFEISGAVHIQQPLAARLAHPGLRDYGQSVTAMRLENFSASIPYRAGRLQEALKPFGEVHGLGNQESLGFWDELRCLSPLLGSTDPVWRISTAPSAGPKVVAGIKRYMDCRAFYDWSGGLVWAEVLPAADAGAADIRRVLASHGGHATLMRAGPEVRAAVEVFQPLEPGLAEIATRLKSVFDPAGILNPRRLSNAY